MAVKWDVTNDGNNVDINERWNTFKSRTYKYRCNNWNMFMASCMSKIIGVMWEAGYCRLILMLIDFNILPPYMCICT